MAKTVKDAEEASPSAEEAENIAAIRAGDARLKAEEKKAAENVVEETETMAEAARKANEKKAEKSAVVRAEKARPKVKANERTAAEKADAVTREVQNSTAKAKEAPAANVTTKRQAAKGPGT